MLFQFNQDVLLAEDNHIAECNKSTLLFYIVEKKVKYVKIKILNSKNIICSLSSH